MRSIAPAGSAGALVWLTAALLALELTGCGGAPEGFSSSGASLALTMVRVEQSSSPRPIPESLDLPARLVTVKVTLAFTAPQKPATLSLVFTTAAGTRSENEVPLTEVAPEVAASKGGQKDFLALVKVPALGALIFDAVLIDHAGSSSAPMSGQFTIQDAVGATQSNGVTQSDQSSGQTTP